EIDERWWRNVLGDIWRAAVDRDAPSIEAVEDLFREVAGEEGVFEHQREAIPGQQTELVDDRPTQDFLSIRVRLRLDRGMAPLPAFAVEIEVVQIRERFDGTQPRTVADAVDRSVPQRRPGPPGGHLPRSVEPARQVPGKRHPFVAV